MMTPTRKCQLAVAAIVTTLILSGVIMWAFDLDEIGPGLVESWGWVAMIGYALLMMILGGLGVPPVIFIVPSVAFWSVPEALVITLTGGFGASAVGFFLSRYGLRETLEPRIPQKIARYEHRLETHGFSTVLVLRLLFYLFPPINWMLGISGIPAPVFFGATLLGILPGTLVYVLTGKGVLAFLKSLGPVQFAALLVLAAVGLWAWFRWATGPDDRDEAEDFSH
jgi:uncharacterized membrane protein YdjX (TVP38/TMEM64 family)